MQEGRAVQLEVGVPFDPIIEVASSDKFLIRQEMDRLRAVIDVPLFSAEVNKNKSLNPDDPASYVRRTP